MPSTVHMLNENAIVNDRNGTKREIDRERIGRML